MDTQIDKSELMHWLSGIEDPSILRKVAEIRTKDLAPFDFDEEWKKGITGEELRKRLLDHIDTLPWKK